MLGFMTMHATPFISITSIATRVPALLLACLLIALLEPADLLIVASVGTGVYMIRRLW
jgi:hypothetical protein